MNPAGSILVTGAGGFVGSWLVPELLEGGYTVTGVHRPDLPRGESDCEWLAADLREREAVRELVNALRPDAVVHLAAVAVPAEAASDPIDALRMNYGAVDHLVYALRESAPEARLLYVGTGDAYGPRAADAPPARESDAAFPPNLYAATKLAGEQRARLAAQREDLDVVCARPFNHTGPGRPADYAESSFARQLVEIERGLREPVLRVGNLAPLRDWSDVRDVVCAYLVLLERGQRGELYNVCSGQMRTVRALLELLIDHSHVELRVEVDPERYRETAPGRLASGGDPAKLKALGWAPRHALEETLGALLEDWRARL